MKSKLFLSQLAAGEWHVKLASLYGDEKVSSAVTRYTDAVGAFEQRYGKDRDIAVFSVCGRSEISGNHTDHNHGKVIAASIELDIIAVASHNDNGTIRVLSRGFDEDTITPESKTKQYSSASLIAGVKEGFRKEGLLVGGFDAYTDSYVLKGSGLSSSAAYENMIGTILNHLYNDGKADDVTISKISQYAENVHFGKPCGLMDQIACITGGFVYIDFADPQNPMVEKLPFDLTRAGYRLVITDTGGNHAALSGEYATIPGEMKEVAAFFNKSVLRDVTQEAVMANMAAIRAKCGDRALLRALHFLRENQRVEKQKEALKKDDLDTFLALVLESGRSSAMYLQNAFTSLSVQEQGIMLALCISEQLLQDKKAAWRLHGGGFAGTIQAFVPWEYAAWYSGEMDKVFGKGASRCLAVRGESGVCLVK